MKATVIYGAGDVRVETRPDPTILEPTDAVVRAVRACVCGSDLHPYRSMGRSDEGVPIGHELLGVVEETGSAVTTVRPGDLVIAPFAWSDNTCAVCRDGFQTACPTGLLRQPGRRGRPAGRARAHPARGRQPRRRAGRQRDEPAPAVAADALGRVSHGLPRRAHGARVPGQTVTVVGDGAVGLSAVLAARQMGAERIILMGRHEARTALGREWGATDVVPERGAEGVQRVLDLTDGLGSHVVLEAVGHMPAYEQSYGVARAGA